MVRNLFGYSRIRTLVTLLAGLLLAFSSFANGHEESDIQEKTSNAKSGSFEEILCNLELTNLLASHHGHGSARANAAHTLQLAKRLGNEQFIFVAKEALTSLENFNSGTRGHRGAIPEYLLDSDAYLRSHYYASLIQSHVWYKKNLTDFKTLLFEYRAAAEETGEPLIILKQRLWCMYAEVRFMDLAPTAAENRLHKLSKLVKEFSYLEGSSLICLIKESGLCPRKNFDEKVKVLEKALSHAVESKNRRLVLECHRSLAMTHLRNRKAGWKQFTFHIDAAIAESDVLGAKFSQHHLLVLKTETAKLYSKNEIALKLNLQVKNSPAFHFLSLLTQDAIRKTTVGLASRMQDQKLKQQAQANLLSAEERDQQIAEEKKARQENEILLESRDQSRQFRAENIATTERMAAENEKAAEAASFYKVLAGCFALLVLLMIPWLYIFRQQLKLNRVSEELNSQRESSRQSEEKCDELSVRINRLQRMESLGLMAGSVAHDFNNILVGVMGNAEVLQMTNEKANESERSMKVDDEFVNQRICSIIRSAEKAANLSRQMLAYAGKQFIARKATDLNELIRQYESILRSTCRKEQSLKFELDSSPVVSKVDTTQIEQVVLNLVTNSAEASGVSDQIIVRTGTQTITSVEDDCSLYGTRTSGGEFNFIEIIDTGSGISTADLERIFEPFFSNSEIGRGLGLSVVYGVVIGHDGFIRCCSNIGKGTSFRVLIPLTTDVTTADIVEPKFDRAAEFDDALMAPIAKKILVIDDEEAVLDLCSQLMELNGWDVISAVGGKAGLDRIEEHIDEIACILVDVVMPEMGANELLNALEDRQINIPVVLMSGFSQTRLEFFLERQNVSSIVQKPFRANEIKRAILNAAHAGTANLVSTASPASIANLESTTRLKNPDNPK